ncbi:hypothetical protein [Thalassovita sp.]|uniref:hypothetical protein n=1 Tax=Thalassovita sp. TaxID=1979401 RepID=UPI002AAF9389|nr:hypothetical protein [Thalassovita sp.]
MIEWENIDVIETGVEHTQCDCCAQTTTRGDGDLSHQGNYIGFYDVRFTSASGNHPPVVTIYVGDFSDTGKRTERWAARASWTRDGCSLLDWPPENKAQITMFTPLDRSDVLGTDFASEFWAMVDAIIMKDTRLEIFH